MLDTELYILDYTYGTATILNLKIPILEASAVFRQVLEILTQEVVKCQSSKDFIISLSGSCVGYRLRRLPTPALPPPTAPRRDLFAPTPHFLKLISGVRRLCYINFKLNPDNGAPPEPRCIPPGLSDVVSGAKSVSLLLSVAGVGRK